MKTIVNLSESDINRIVKKVLLEKEDDFYLEVEKNFRMIGKFMKMNFPGFTKENTEKIKHYFEGRDSYGNELRHVRSIEYKDKKTGVSYCRYYEGERTLELFRLIFERLETVFGDDKMLYVIDWFNKKFGMEAENVSF